MKLELNDKAMLFSVTDVPDIFFTEYLGNIQGDYVKIYLYLIFLAKYNRDVKINDLSKKLSLPVNVISEGVKYLEKEGLILRKNNGFIVVDLQELVLNNLYSPKIQTSAEKIEENAKNKERIKLIEYLNNRYFQGVMGPTWYNDIDLWFRKYEYQKDYSKKIRKKKWSYTI